MASPALELADGRIDVTGVPGVTAALAAGAVLGAPLGHDHALISLSDLHTQWQVIERRVRAVAEADLVTCFYNPVSRTRNWQLGRALAILAEHRPPGTPVGWVRDVSRPGERAGISTLAGFDPAAADMHTLVVVGSSATTVVAGRMVTGPGTMAGPEPATGPAAAVVTTACRGCGACLLTCPEHAIRPFRDGRTMAPLTVLPGRCTGCGECVEICPADAIFLAEEVMTW